MMLDKFIQEVEKSGLKDIFVNRYGNLTFKADTPTTIERDKVLDLINRKKITKIEVQDEELIIKTEDESNE